MARQYIVNSWVGAAEYDEGDTYNGQQVGNRNQKSIGVLIERSGDQWKAGNVDQQIPTFINGRANVAAFADKPLPKTTKKTISIRDRICPQQKTYERLEQMQKDLEQDFLAGKIADEEYLSLSAVLDKKMQRAWTLLCKAMNWKDDTEQELYCDDFYPTENSQQGTCLKVKQNRELVGVLGMLNDDNVFRMCWCHWLSVKRFCGDFSKELKKFVDKVKAGI